ncbi:Os12g0408100 [Oryza sativa Japonica Group]|uniref:Os12g0408100 protein n=2 Tax=Oryza sativa subsp. japonica TaxID=39947 RepID=Q0INQ8_ORYSJ|nr:hypothetical protein EE612_059131 [Oryza sativa]BAF29657.1 Os12g0408100 [Oryza sativa Japonica Group]BAT16848.1 Os12g0408100 [Oryza sativa Japonica Group]|eukprot:NP_001066638.1 Os12g0408100 [Oryza sativa Japonica Group]
MAPCDLAVLERVGSDVVRTSEMQQQEGSPEGDEPVAALRGAEGEPAEGVRRGDVGELVRQPEDSPPFVSALAPPDAGEEEREELLDEAEDYKDLGCPFAPKAQQQPGDFSRLHH